MAVYLVCEGPADGLDVRVLDLIIAQKLGKAVQIIPAGGSSSLRSVRWWMEERSRTQHPDGTWRHPHDKAYAIEDRNFQFASNVEDGWQKSNRNRWLWRRHEIENYLLDPRLVAYAFQEIQKVPIAQQFTEQLPDTESKALNLLQQVAQPMLEDYAGQLVCQQLRFYKGDTANTNLNCPQRPSDFVPSSTSPYADQTEWLNYLQTECQRLKEAGQQLCNDTKFDLPNIETEYNQHLSAVNKPEFLEKQFLADMGGHELMNAFLRYIRQDVGMARLTYAVLTDELIKALDALYQPGFFEPDDFSELANKLI